MAMPADIGRRWTSREVRRLIEDSQTLSWHPAGATTAFTLDLSAFFESVFSTD